MEWGLLWFHHALFLLFIFLDLVQSPPPQKGYKPFKRETDKNITSVFASVLVSRTIK